MKTAILIHGTSSKEEYYSSEYPSASNFHWFPWLSKQLIIRDIHTIALEMPHSYTPNYTVWKKELERFDIDENTILVGHSCGGGFLVRYLSENPSIKVRKIILVAPWIDPFNKKDKDFFDFKIRQDISIQVLKGITLFHSTDDMKDVHISVKKIMEEINNIHKIEFINKGHFCLSDLGTEKFTELLDEVLK